MSQTFQTFIHPGKVYQLEYPSPWEHLEKDEGRSCGFGPRDRDDVGLWISIIPMSIDTDRLMEDLPRLMQETMGKSEATNLREDASLRHYGMKADMTKEGEGGHYWVVTGGDVVLFASSQVPTAERDLWNPAFDRLMSSLRITRDDALFLRKVANEVLRLLREKHPDEEFEFDDKGIRGKHRAVYLGNLYREVQAAPRRQDKIIKNFVDGLSQAAGANMGYEIWEDAQKQIIPVLKPRDYIDPNTPTQHLLVSEWLADVVICYVIKSPKFFRFVTGWDVNRWETTADELHQIAIANLSRLPWPKRMEGSRGADGGRIILIDTNDSLASSRILHPELHRLFSGPLGSPFWAGIPNRNTLVVFSDRRALKQRLSKTLRKDHFSSAYPIIARPFLVTADGIALGGD
jgi:uncharacterized protein YtpQ (UPF0354 family)